MLLAKIRVSAKKLTVLLELAGQEDIFSGSLGHRAGWRRIVKKMVDLFTVQGSI